MSLPLQHPVYMSVSPSTSALYSPVRVRRTPPLCPVSRSASAEPPDSTPSPPAVLPRPASHSSSGPATVATRGTAAGTGPRCSLSPRTQSVDPARPRCPRRFQRAGGGLGAPGSRAGSRRRRSWPGDLAGCASAADCAKQIVPMSFYKMHSRCLTVY